MTMIPVDSAKLEQAAEQIHQLQKRIAELEAMLESIGAGGVGPLMAPASSNHVEQHLGMVPAGWKLVPVEPTDEMVEAGDHEIEKWGVDASSSGVFRAMLAAAPQLPTVKECLTVEQPQVEQEPVAEITGMDEYGPMLGWHSHWTTFDVGTKLYTHQQTRREPLTESDIDTICSGLWSGGWRRKAMNDFARAIERAHGVTGE